MISELLWRLMPYSTPWSEVSSEEMNGNDEAIGDESMLDDQGIAALNLAHIAYEKNELDQAEQFARRALDLARQRANEMLQAQAAMRLAASTCNRHISSPSDARISPSGAESEYSRCIV